MSHADEVSTCVERRSVARKPHRCSACRETISPGCVYSRIAVISDGSADTVKQCARCRAIWEAIAKASRGEPILLELDCGESWEDAFGEPCPPEVEALAFMLPTDTDAGDG